ncbi:hypothetical protein [Microvirga subterranea]|uniref:Uncharacterized protein n=1 Tax=Microvirga subterranea TaxID=186651 RepID=A0A370HN11_9HYPH|nr:hypothetical protein [Microvirga subterranea]RDI59899.1 hypothetical protein DES45_103155 [Microvirga subterranea]
MVELISKPTVEIGQPFRMSKVEKNPSKAKDLQEPARASSLRPRDRASADETARYIAEFTAELAFLAQQAELDLLAYLLDMARLEATRSTQSGAG